MSAKKKLRALEQRVADLTRENDARKRAACEHPNRIWSHNVFGAPDQFTGVMDTYGWKCDACGTGTSGNSTTVMDGWPQWVQQRFGRAVPR